MQVISLFSGIGGFELAAKEIGWDIVVSCELNSFGQDILKNHYPNTYHHKDIKTLNYEIIKEKSQWNPHADTIVCGGFP
jgi:DNA (cytosine-5)-methyltransferase 1